MPQRETWQSRAGPGSQRNRGRIWNSTSKEPSSAAVASALGPSRKIPHDSALTARALHSKLTALGAVGASIRDAIGGRGARGALRESRLPSW